MEASSCCLPSSYQALLHPDRAPPSPTDKPQFRRLCVAAGTVLILCLLSLAFDGGWPARSGGPTASHGARPGQARSLPLSRGPAQGISEKSTASRLFSSPSFGWSDSMLLWQRTAFHFQPEKNWMNDPNGPMYYKGWYHLFYQYNPEAAVWGNISWGHAVSKNLVHWLHLPLAMVPDRWYDANGAWTGSATILPDGRLAMLYTGATTEWVQVQNLAFPADPSDPLLLAWVKAEANPVVVPPPGVNGKDFRDPTTAWYVASEDAWLVAIGSKNDSQRHAGTVLIYKTDDFQRFELLPNLLHAVEGTGMWECVDFFPVATEAATGLDTSEPAGNFVKHVLKVSLDDDRNDYYAIGTYDAGKNEWVPDDPDKDVGIGLRYDYGRFYASKTFFDPVMKRRILLGWISESDSERTDAAKGWASLMSIPRTLLFDKKTGSNLLQWPVYEVDTLRLAGKEFGSLQLAAGSVIPLDVGSTATQLDIVAEFAVSESALSKANEAELGGYSCSSSGGSADRGLLGPFGLLLLADQERSEQTAVYFYLRRGAGGSMATHFCQDELRSSEASDTVKRVHGSIVPVLEGETLSVRILVDHSIVESFAQGGRRCITSRVYPTRVMQGVSRVFLFNNATSSGVTCKSLKVWQMNSAFIRPFNDHDESSATRLYSSIFSW